VLDESVEVVERDAPEQPWVGVVAIRFDGTLESAVAEAAPERASTRPAEVYADLVRAGNPPTGYWNTLRTSGDPEGLAEMVLTYAVAAPLPSGWGGPDVEIGVLRRDGSWSPGGAGTPTPCRGASCIPRCSRSWSA
jgi:hypothetical protein